MICTQFSSIHDIDEARWGTVTAGNLPLSYPYVCLIESCWPSFKPCYFLLEDDSGPCAVVVINTIEAFRNRGIVRWLYQRFNLAVRSPCVTDCAVVTRPGIALEAVLPELVSAMQKLCWDKKRLFMIISNVNSSNLPAWQRAGFLATAQKSVNILDLPETYELYLKMLRPKDRAELRRIHKRADEVNARFEIGTFREDSAKIYDLFSEVYARHGILKETLPFDERFFIELEREMPDKVFVIKGFIQDELVGAFLCHQEGPTLWWQIAGLNYQLARPNYLYFLLMDEMIRWSIEHGIQRIYGGFSNDQEKRGHGFHTEQSWFCYRASIPFLNRILALLLPVAQRLVKPQRK